MRLSKEISQLDRCNNRQNHIKSPLYHGLSTGKSSVRDHRGPSAHHSSVVDTRSGSHRSDDSVGLFGHDQSVDQSQRGTQSGYQIKSVNQAQDVLIILAQFCYNIELTLRPEAILDFYTPTQALTTKRSSKLRRTLTQKLTLAEERTYRLFLKSFELQQLRISTPALIQGSKWVANERAKLGESSATQIVKNRGWNRREMAIESDGEQ
ncbi:Chorismate mutase 1 [Dorcoceras hygrometricum]|uniref:Chorismate mutase 1 n=1 Tax=Dorcoceras hygrometricum TaxID=472368 RepID=A0A2Z7ANV2_9LAMI|nr:Chorismate mutase 1 [Dorcoceras hygrometricum]